MAGKTYKLELSDPKDTYSATEMNMRTGARERTSYNTKEQETKIIANLLNIALNKITDKKEVMRCLDTMGMIDNIDKENSIEIIQEELDWLHAGIEGSVDQRNMGWVHCREIIRQINDPEEVGVKVVKKDKKE